MPASACSTASISRGVADRISAVLWFSDLRGYTKITDTAPPREIIPLLNDYADARHFGHPRGRRRCPQADRRRHARDFQGRRSGARPAARRCRPRRACGSAWPQLNARRLAEDRPVTTVYIGLHIGEVFYGNVGSEDRLDFTVVGPAVNEASRIASMCRSVDRHIVLSADFVAATPEPERSWIVSVGRYALRGVGRSQELFTLDPERL